MYRLSQPCTGQTYLVLSFPEPTQFCDLRWRVMLPTACTPVNTVPHPYGQGTLYSAPLLVDLAEAKCCTFDELDMACASFGQLLEEV